MSSRLPTLFQPIKVGDVQLRHRVVLAPSTRFRSNAEGVPSLGMAEYYAQRGSTPGTLLIAEATLIARKAGGFRNVPGIWSAEQIAAWKQVTDAVHAKGSFIYLQLWAFGRAAYVEHLAPGDPYVSSSTKTLGILFHRDATPRSGDVPRPMTVDEIKEYSELFAVAASNAVHKAGFDGVEVHAANGYLPEQFLMNSVNDRTDEYGGSIENRARFTLEVLDAIVPAVGASKTAVRLSPWNKLQDSGMVDPVPTYSYLVKEIRDRHPNLGYLHVVEEPAIGDDRERGLRMAESKGDIIAYSRAFIANPDLPCRLFHDIPLVKGDGAKYYTPYGSSDPSGYIDYAFHFVDLNREVAVG
ncbi:NADH:flavin oxidoreductase/NADH oxidase [Mycena maculata]|uniref:NADH:flavin oxidoreductase/NADH oxidase n=1 Tax=Mycena maculata TaxID=230809 RepID=A0AAD7NBW8_9AGAR|nr:NADH:flavin oxidoreductase/NADH oxidase [Mycena maculata]